MCRFVAIFFSVLVVISTAPLSVVRAAMSSASYVMPSDALGDTGGQSCYPNCAGPTGFIVNDTMGELSATMGQGSASFSLNSGFQAMTPEPVFTFTISGSSATLLPAPSVLSTATDVTTVTTSTNAPFGYTTTIVDDGALRDGANTIADVSDGLVGPVGTEEYGISLAGTDRAFTDDQATVTLPRTSPPAPRVIASYNGFGAGRATTVTYKFNMATSTINGNYGHVVTFVSSPNY